MFDRFRRTPASAGPAPSAHQDHFRGALSTAEGTRPRRASFSIGTAEIDPALFGLESWGEGNRIAGRITRREALQVPAVLRARNLIAGTLGSLPIDVHNRDRSLAPAAHSSVRFLSQVDRRVPRSVTIAYTIEDLLFEGVAWWRITGFAWDGFPAVAERVDPCRVSEDPDTHVVQIDGRVVPDGELIRFTSPNPPLLVHAARAIRTALTLDTAAANYANSPRPLGMFTPADGTDPSDDEDDEGLTRIQAMLDAWEAARQTNADAYVGAALKYTPLSWSPADLQLADARQHAVLEIARATGIDPEELGVSTTSRTYQNDVSRNQAFVNQTLAPYIAAVEERLSMPDVTPQGKYAKFDIDDFLKADPATRWATYQTGTSIGALTVDEVREAEELPPMPPGQGPSTVVDTPADAVGTADVIPGAGKSDTVDARRPAALSFSRVEGISFDTEQTAAAFSVDEQARTITGLAVPYGPVAKSGFSAWRFQQGSLKWHDPGRVKLLQDHDSGRAVGKAVRLDDRADGLWSTFKVARGPEGDAVLASAADGVRDGLSVGIDFTDDTGWVPDPADRTVRLVQRAALREVSITAMPAFDDSRVSGVAAASTERDLTMTAPDESSAPPPAPDLSELSGAITAGFTAAFQQLADVTPARQVVPAGGVSFGGRVTEEPLYAFHGRPSKHEFSSDLIAGLKGDGEKLGRVLGFMRAQFDIDTADVNELNPSRQRPDMYVDQLDYVTPVWNAINKGTLPDQTPFVLPKFATATGLVADHVEGTEPTPGAFTTTGQTITPTAMSGKVEITREVWDQGGNPQLSTIIWRQMLRAWSEALEVKAVAMLDALSPTAIALNGIDTDLQADVVANLVALQYIRGGNRFRDFVLASDLFGALVGASDGDGRLLFPVLGATNAAGSTNGAFGRVLIGDTLGVPSWALETGNGGDGSSYLFNREDVHGWASTPRRLDFEYRVAYVDLAIWGYVATACTRTDGVREVTYSAS